MARANTLSASMKLARRAMGAMRSHTNRMRVLAFGRSRRTSSRATLGDLCPPRRRMYKLPVNSWTHYCKEGVCDITGSKHGGR